MNLAESLYEVIRTGIIEGRYRPRERLVEEDLANDLSASRTPVRQALQRLELDGLVQTSRGGWTIREHTTHDVEDIYDIRVPLEGYASRLATERGNDHNLNLLDEAYESLVRSTAGIIGDPETDRGEFVRLHDAFHEAIFRAAQNNLLRDAIMRHRQHPYNRRIAHLYRADEITAISDSHATIHRAIRAGDPDTADRLTREHLMIAKEATIKLLRNAI